MKTRQKTILVTGVNGFIGSHLAESLLKNRYLVIGVDNFSGGGTHAKTRLKEVSKNPSFTFYHADILDLSALHKIFSSHPIDTVVHLAAKAGVRPSLEAPQDYFTTNVIGTINILESIRKHHIQQMIFASSSSVYGNNSEVPFSETHTTDKIISPYGASKKSAEIICKTYAELYQINTTIFRFFSVFGPHGRQDMAPYIFANAILNNKTIHKFGNSIKRDYTYIDDIVNGIMKGIQTPFSFEVINLGNNAPIHLEELITNLEIHLSKKATVNHEVKAQGDVDITYANIQKAKQILDWEPKVGINEGLRLFANWMKSIHLKNHIKTSK